MDTSIFMDKALIPNKSNLKEALGNTFNLWMNLRDYVFDKYPKAFEEWHFPGTKYGWGFRIKDKKRAIIYMSPRDKAFKVSFVFGRKATEQALGSTISDTIKKIIIEAPVYAEGRGVRIDVLDDIVISDIKILVDIKIAN